MPGSDAPLGRWRHAHEEDTADELVFRPDGHPLPPARGRSSFELHADGTYSAAEPGPADLPEVSGGRWTLDGDTLTLTPTGATAGRRLQIVAASPDRLCVSRSTR